MHEYQAFLLLGGGGGRRRPGTWVMRYKTNLTLTPDHFFWNYICCNVTSGFPSEYTPKLIIMIIIIILSV